MTNQKSEVSTSSVSRKPWISRTELLVLAAMIAIALASRFWIETPNFKPIAAFALFGGFFFRRPLVAIGGVLLMMGLSDMQLGLYHWQMMLTVYVSMAISVGLGVMIRNRPRKTPTRLCGEFVIASLVMSTLFFVLTNGAVWLSGSWYPTTTVGLIECFSNALPFYRWTMMGDLFFTAATVGSYLSFGLVRNSMAKSISLKQLEPSV